MEVKKLTYATGIAEDYLHELFSHQDSCFDLQYGTAFLKQGTRTPFQGDFTKHDQAKIVCVLSGKVRLTLEKQRDNEVIVTAGDLFKVEKFEGHSGEVLEDTHLIYVMYGKKEK